MPDPDTLQAPFAVALRRDDPGPGGRFVPGAALQVTPALRTSGLLMALPAEDLRSLLLVLTFLSPSGDCLPSAQELAAALRTSPHRARARMRAAARFTWAGEPILREVGRPSGMDAFAPSPRLLAFLPPPPDPEAGQGAPARTAGREAVIAQSRQRYATPRGEAEATISRLMGWNARGMDAAPPAEPQDPHIAALRGRLLDVGLAPWQADALLAQYPPEAVERQLDWLPYRAARNPAGLLTSAVMGDYAPPRGLPGPTEEPAAGTGAMPEEGEVHRLVLSP